LTLRGFKSFASSTTLHFEPGITCVVGPNGSGKSNVVDALAWVMGEQGAKSLRGGKMEDVIFAGTSGRQALGRAEVVLTIDNTDGALPIDYAEVTISRTMFRSGGSEYAINGESCRLLDVQELLSDSGIGREMHVVVGQGQLDTVLTASTEDRRGFIEEAAGVLKHRKRKEKALRKLEAMQANLTRVQDLTTELRRQLGPLGRQAQIARKAATIQAELRDARLRLLADELVQARATLSQEMASETALREKQSGLFAALDEAKESQAHLEAELRDAGPRLAQAQEAWYRLAGLRERLRGTATLAAERQRHLAEVPADDRPGRDPDQLEREAAAVRAQETELSEQIGRARNDLDVAVASRRDSEAAAQAEETRLAGLARAAADRRAGVARLAGELEGLRTKAEAAAAEVARLERAGAEANERSDEAMREFTALESTVAALSADEQGHTAELERCQGALDDADATLDAVQNQLNLSERDRSALAARREALEMGLGRKDGSGALLAASDRISGVLGSVAALLAVEPGWEAAVAAALGSAADAVAVEGVDDAVAALRLLRDDDLGSAGLLVGGGTCEPPSAWPRLPGGLRYVAELITASSELTGSVHAVLRGVVAVDDLPSARALVAELPDVIAATRDGDVLGAYMARGGSSAAPSLLEVQAAVDEAADQLAEAERRVKELSARQSEAVERRDHAAADVAGARARVHEADSMMSATAERLAAFGQAAKSGAAEAERLAAAAAEAAAARDRDESALAGTEQRLAAAEGDGASDDAEPSTGDRDRLAEEARAARQAETEARLALRTAEERARALSGRAESLERAARAERETQQRARAQAERRTRLARVAGAVAQGAGIVLDRLELSLGQAGAQRTAAEDERVGLERRHAGAVDGVSQLTAKLNDLTSSVHQDELARAEQRMRVEALETKALDELSVVPDVLVDEYGPDQPIPVPPDEDGEPREPVPFERDAQLKRGRSAERAMAQLGRVNPLALEEYAALEERHRFLVDQLEDLKKTRRDLLDIVKEVDERVEQVFAAAYEDTAREFADVIGRLFPGGEGRLVLTEPDDMLATGIDVEARPPGKKIKRLSLLSGGERSLVAVAFLIALFKARPSPFYVLDEVEAALDDVNLGRLLELYEELRVDSQLIVITHQKRTMEIADALYGASMRDGITALISQRIRERV
jgi:chromosome segregation protein